MRSFAGRFGSNPNSTVPMSFSYAPAAPNARPFRTTSRCVTCRRTTRASAVVAQSRHASAKTLFLRIGNIPARLVDQARNLLQLHVVNLFGTVVPGVVVGVQARHEAERRHTALQERPLIAPAHE